MGELKMEGLLSQIFRNTPLAQLNITPQLVNRDLVITLTEEQFKQLILSGLDERGRRAVDIKLEQGRLIIKIRLF